MSKEKKLKNIHAKVSGGKRAFRSNVHTSGPVVERTES